RDLGADHGRQLRHLRIAAAPHEHVGEVDPAGAHAHERLPVRLGVGDVDDLERAVDLAQERGSHVFETGSCANWSRSAVLRNLPTLVFGISSTNSKRSGSHHLANCGARYSRSSSAVAVAPSLTTTAASGRSDHFSSGIAITAASATAGCPISAFSSSTEEIHSPPDLITSFERSLIWM